MSFRMFAVGTGNFGHERNWTDEGDVYELGSMIGDAMDPAGSVGDAVRGAVEDEVTDRLTPDDPVQQGLNAIGRMACGNTLRDAFTLLLAHGEVNIAISATGSSSIPGWPDPRAFVSNNYSSRWNSTFGDFMRDITPALEETDLNRFTVLCAIAEEFARWDGAASHGQRRLQMEITST